MAFASCTLPADGSRDPGEVSGQGAGHLQVHSRRVVLAPVTAQGCWCHDQQDTKGAVDDVLADLGRGPSPEVSMFGGVRRSRGCGP